ncbi:hypothetical protein BVRB_007780 isoform A [Beta vulgaris subsp. vulgaris]|uniref:Uncharacterized protein n=1 Tax=Beta vulgaris subsp. vulgaris TaxID=3555 RepID=A0A0J8DX99_BETVV|nr:hypothetical protein BVRB_007780 isoform A [Beta vulgaris subsp. vulgaris]
MPGTIHVSVLELVGLPSPPQSSSMGVKVSMGKKAHEMRDKEETSLPLASLRDILNVSVHDFEGNEIAHTDVETRSIVEKVIWDDLFPLKGGGNIRLRLHFLLTEDEQNRIRIMRESAARRKQEDLLKRRHSSSALAHASVDSIRSQIAAQEKSVDPSDSQAHKISAEFYNKNNFLKKAQLGQKKQAFSTSKSTGALDKLPAYQHLKERLQGQDAEQQSDQSDKSPSNIRKMILAFESSPVKEESPATNKTRETPQLSSSTMVDVPAKVPSLKKTIPVNNQLILSGLETKLAFSIPQEIEKERGKLLPAIDKPRETYLISSIGGVDTPPKVPNIKKTVTIGTKPILSKIETVRAPSIPEEIGEERGKLLPATIETKETAQLSHMTTVTTQLKVPSLKKKVAANNKPAVSNLETAPTPSTPEEIGKESGKFLPTISKTKETTQLSSITSVDTPFKVPIVKKTFTISTKPALSNLETASAPSTPQKTENEIGKQLSATNEPTQLSHNAAVDTPPYMSILKKTIIVNNKSVLSNLEKAPASSTSQELGKEKGESLPNNKTKETTWATSNSNVDASSKVILKKIVDAYSETASAISAPEETQKGRGKDNDYGAVPQETSDENNISKTQPTEEENEQEKNCMEKLHTSPVSEKSIFSLKTLLAALPRRKKFSTDMFSKKYGFTSNDPLVIEKKWRSKQWKSSQRRVKSKISYENKRYSIDNYRGWMFLDEMIHSCVLSDDRPFVDVLGGCRSNCSQDNDQEKLPDTGDHTQSKKPESSRRHNDISIPGPAGQVMKIAVMVGFGVLVLLTRQRN